MDKVSRPATLVPPPPGKACVAGLALKEKPGMQILRPAPGSGGSEETKDAASSEVASSKKWFLQFLFAVLFLVIGMVVFFVGGVVVRNPQLPNYLLDQIVTRFRGETGKTANSIIPENDVSSAENLKPPPPPATPEQYMNLMSFDEKTLPPDERAAVSVLNQTVAHLEESSFAKLTSDLAPLFNDQIVPGVSKLQPGDDVTQIRAAIEKCRGKAMATIQFYEELAEQVAGKLIAAGVPPSMAHQVGELFARRARSEGNISLAAEVNVACSDITTIVDLLSKNPSKWKRTANGTVVFTTKGLVDRFNAASRDLHAAVKELGGH